MKKRCFSFIIEHLGKILITSLVLGIITVFVYFSLNSKNKYSNNSDEQTTDNSSSCKFEDDTYSATVDYNNSETGYSATYTLDVDVVDCQVVQINFPNDGYLDDDHISPADLDDDGNATVNGEDGKTYVIQIDN